METKFQTSFIPKTTIATTNNVKPRRHTSLLLVFSFFVFLVSLLLGGLAFGYEKIVERDKLKIQKDLEENIKDFEPDTIKQYARLDTRIDTAKSLLEKHIALTLLLDFLGKETLKSVRYFDMKYELANDGKSANIVLNGQATTYNAVAYQASVFGKKNDIKNPLFSGLDLDKQGNVLFNLAFKIDPSFVYYKKKAGDYLKGDQQPQTVMSGADEEVDL